MSTSNLCTIRRVAGAVVVLCVGVVAALAPSPASAVQVPQATVVSSNPANWTPNVLDGQVNSIVQIGSTVYLGGRFSRVQPAGGGAEVARTNIVAFDATNGTIRPFAPVLDGEVEVIIAAPDGASIYIGGSFATVNGVTTRRLARLSTSTGTAVAGFRTPTLNGTVRDLRLQGNRLWLAGNFTHVAGVAQPGLATVNATTGVRDPFMALPITGVHNGGTTFILKIDLTPDGSRLFAIGNFTTVDGQPRRQVAAFDLGGASAALSSWTTTFYTSTCSSSFNTYMRDLDISPDGTYVVFTTTGGYGGFGRACDTAARFEVGSVAADVRPTWVDVTGGDTLYAVAVTGEAVYIGGHQRWLNNPFRGDTAGPGAVSREGIAALDPANGLPLSWNPGRTRGVGVFDLLATPAGLWVGSDTDRIGDFEYHARIAFFPLQGGTDLPPNQPGRLPGRAYLLGTGTTANVAGRWFDGTTTGATEAFGNGGVTWQSIRGAVMIDGTLYTGQSDGAFVARSFDGTTFGAPTPVNTADLLVVDSAWHNDVRNITGMFFESGRLYYTVANQSSLFFRYFTPESGIVGAQRFVASAGVPGLSFATVRTMFAGGGYLYFTATTTGGNLHRVAFTDGVPTGGVAVVSGPTVDGVDWAAQEVFLFTGAVSAPSRPPTAVASVACNGMQCTASGAGSTDVDGTITSYSWNFGDGSPNVSGDSAGHTYAAPGTYTIRLTVTDNSGGAGTTTTSVTVQAAPTAAFTSTCDITDCAFDASASTDSDGTVASYSWDFGDGTAPGSGATASHSYAVAGDYTVTLTVTDDDGATSSTSRSVHAAADPATITFVGGATSARNGTIHQVALPEGTEVGDGLLLFVSNNNPNGPAAAPTGGGTWTLVDSISSNTIVTQVWKAQAGASPAGATVQVTTAALAKVNVTVLAYRGTAADPVAAFARAAETSVTTAHATPVAPVDGAGSWVVSYWAQKDSDSTFAPLTPPASVTSRSAASGPGTGRVVSLAADSAGPVPQGSTGGHVATANAATRQATMWTIVLRPG